MKFNSKKNKDRSLKGRELKKNLLVLVLLFGFCTPSDCKDLKLIAPIQNDKQEENIPSQIDLSIIPNFPKISGGSEGRRISAGDTFISLNTPLKLSIDSFIDSKTAMIGDYFKAHILEDFYISADKSQLVLPKNSWVRGRISFLKRPNFFVKSAKIGLHLDQIVTPLGDTLILDAELDVQKGLVTENGTLRPVVSNQPSQQILPNPPVPVNNLGPSLLENLLTGKLYALFSQNDTTTLSRGQELQIVLQRNLQLTGN